jgi:hypothetical protein
MAEPRYYLDLSGEGRELSCKLYTLQQELCSHQELSLLWNDALSGAALLNSWEEQLVRCIRQCVVSANAAPGKIARLQIRFTDEAFFVALKERHGKAVVIHSTDTFDEQLQQCLDEIRFAEKENVRHYSYYPLHAWVLQRLSKPEAESAPIHLADGIALSASDFFDSENNQWHKEALKALDIFEKQLPNAAERDEALAYHKTGLVTSVANFPITLY